MADEMRMALEALLRQAAVGEAAEFLREGVFRAPDKCVQVVESNHPAHYASRDNQEAEVRQRESPDREGAAPGTPPYYGV